MKVNKKQIGIIVGLICAIVLILVLLTMCNGSGYGGHQGDTLPNDASQEATSVATEEPNVDTEATESTEITDPTEATEETSEATEETTEPTEETTSPTTPSTGGNTKPGGSGGYVPDYGDDDDDDTSSGPVTEKAPAAGSEKSPYVEVISQFPDSFRSVTVSKDGTVYHHLYGAEGSVLTIADSEAYVIYNGTTYAPDENGVIQVPFPADDRKDQVQAPEDTENTVPDAVEASDAEAEDTPSDTETGKEEEPVVLPEPQIIQLGSKSTEARSFLLTFAAPAGTKENPEAVEPVDGLLTIETSLEAGDADGYFYQYTPDVTGLLTLQLEASDETAACDIIVTAGEEILKLSEMEDGILTVNLTAFEPVLIQVVAVPSEDGTYPAAQVKIQGQIDSTAGTPENPIDYMGQFPIVTDVLAPGAEVYYNIYGAGGMILTINDPDAYVIMGEEKWTAVDGVVTGEVVASNPRMPVAIGIGNAGESEKSFTADFQYKPGHMMNPAPLNLEEANIAVIGAGSTDGMWYTWTAENEGTLTVTMPEGNWVYLINNITASVYGDMQYSDAEEPVSMAEIPVAAGDELNIMVCTYDPVNPFEYPEGQVVFYASFAGVPGTKDNPIWLWDMENTIELQPNVQVYCNVVMSGVDMEVLGEGSVTVTYNGESFATVDGSVTVSGVSGSRFEPVPVLLTNYGAEAKTVTVRFIYPLGNAANPEILDEMGAYSAAVPGEGNAYFYNWTTLADGQFTITMPGDDWTYMINNLTSSQYGDLYSSAEGSENSLTLDLAAGDTLEIAISTSSGLKKDVPVVFDFYDPTYGTAENPVFLTDMETVLTVRAGTQLHANAVFGGANMTVTGPKDFKLTVGGVEYASENGILVLERVEATRFAPLKLLFAGGETTEKYTVSFAYPVGNGANPEVIGAMGQYTASVIGTEPGYFYTWTAEVDGLFIVTMLGDDWTFCVNNITKGSYSDIHSSMDGSASTLTIDVTAGDEIQLVVGTASAQDKDVLLEIEAGDPTYGTAENPIFLTELENSLMVKAGKELYVNAVLGGADMTISGPEGFTVTVGGQETASENGVVVIPKIEATRFAPVQLVLTNGGDTSVTYSISFAFPLGNSSNPEIIEAMGRFTASVSDDGSGYFYNWTAENDGVFTVTMLCEDWTFALNNLTTGSYGEIQSSAEGSEAAMTVEVAAGDEIQVIIATASGEAGTVIWEAADYDTSVGTAENPVFLVENENTLVVGPGKTFYAKAVLGGANMTISADADFTVTIGSEEFVSVNGTVTVPRIEATRFAPLQLVLTNNSESSVSYSVSFAFPVGNVANPEMIKTMGKYTASVSDDGSGYFYSWTAVQDGIFTVTALGQDWTFVLNNLTTGSYSDIHSSADGSEASLTVDVTAGDEIQVILGTASGNAGDVEVEFLDYDPTVGTTENPIWLSNLEQTITVRPNASMHCNVIFGGTIMTVTGEGAFTVTLGGVEYSSQNGVVTVPEVEASRNMPARLILGTAGQYTVSFAYPVGSMANPQLLTEMGQYTASVKADAGGYFYSFTPEEDGELTITMLGDDWIYSLYNLTTGIHGGNRDSGFGDEASQTMAVKAGEELQINVGTSSFQDKDVELTFAFQPAPQVFQGSYSPKEFEVLDEEIQEMGLLDLTERIDLWASKAGIYHLDSKQGPLVLLNFTDDTYVNLKDLVEDREIFIDVTDENGNVKRQSCNALLESYIENAWIVPVKGGTDMTLYPLTEDLEMILKALGEELGWYDPESEGYLFAEETDAADPSEGSEEAAPEGTVPVEEAPQLKEESLWLFACSYLEFRMEEEPEETVPEVTEEPAEEPTEAIPQETQQQETEGTEPSEEAKEVPDETEVLPEETQ